MDFIHKAPPIEQRQPPNDLYAICNELRKVQPLGSDVSSGYVQLVIQHLFRNVNVDLCAIYPNSGYGVGVSGECIYNTVFELINARSVFFDAVVEDPVMADELWSAILAQCDASRENPTQAQDSVLLQAIVSYVMRLFPSEEPTKPPTYELKPTTPSRRRIQTPLQLIRPTSPLLSNISIKDKSVNQSQSFINSTSLHPRHVTIYCNFVTKACSTQTYATFIKLTTLRYLVKQFFVFTLDKTTDSDVNAAKTALSNDPPFTTQLYAFLHTSIDQCPSIAHFRELTSLWLTFARPWRYQTIRNASSPPEIEFLQFAQNHEQFYRVLLGKIIKKLSAFDTTPELLTIVKNIAEFAWKEPHSVIVRKLGLNIIPHLTPVLEQLQKVLHAKKAAMEESEKNSTFFGFLFTDSAYSETSPDRILMHQITEVLTDSDKFIGTHLIREDPAIVNSSILTIGGNSLLNDTPKSGLLPDHIIEPRTNLMILTPEGRKQVLTNERKFNMADYSAALPPPSGASSSEVASLVTPLDNLAWKLSRWPSVKSLADFYTDQSPAGWIVRQIMYPPVPNPMVSVPVYSPNVKSQPPLLKLRFFARHSVLVVLSVVLLSSVFGRWFLLVVLLFYLLAVFVAVLFDAQPSFE